MSIESVMPSNHLIFNCPLLLPPSIFPSIGVFSDESVLLIRWPNYWSFSFSISPSNEYSGLISFRIDWLNLLAVQRTLKSFLQNHSSKASILQHSLKKQWQILFWGAPKSLQMVAAWNSKRLAPWKKSYDQPRQHTKKKRHYFINKGLSSQSYGFSSSQVWMWELDYKESWVMKNWCFWTVVGEDSWESLGLQGDQTSLCSRKPILNIH